jgi:hypothetical protein
MWTTFKKTPSSDQRPAFVQTAEAFCAHIEGAATSDRLSFVPVCFTLISRMLSEVIELPQAQGTLNTHNVSEERYNGIAELLKGNLQEDDYYTMMWDPYEIAAAPMVGSVCDDLSNIWRGAKDGLEALRKGNLENAVTQWRFSFANEWGEPATHVLRPLMMLLYKRGTLERTD